MSLASPTNRKPLARLVSTALLTLVLASCGQSGIPTTPQTDPPTLGPEKIRALFHGPVESAFLEPLKATLEMVTYDGSQQMEDFDMLILDGDVHTPTAVKEHPLVANAWRANKWILALDVTAEHKRHGLGGLANASSGGNSPAYAVMMLHDARGRPMTHIVENLPATPLQPSPNSTVSSALADTSPQATVGAEGELASAFADALLPRVKGDPALAPAQSEIDPTPPPQDAIYATFYYTQVKNWQTPSAARQDGTQYPSYTLNYTYTVFLNNKNAPQGDFQYVVAEVVAQANPGEMVALDHRDDSDWDNGTFDEQGWFQTKLALTLDVYTPKTTSVTLVESSPETVNGDNSVTDSLSFSIGYADGGGTSSFSYQNSKTRDIKDWQVSNVSTDLSYGSRAAWDYQSSYPLDASKGYDCRNLGLGTNQPIWNTVSCYLAQSPNLISQKTLQLHALAYWKTGAVVDGEMAFQYAVNHYVADLWCATNQGAVCSAASNWPGAQAREVMDYSDQAFYINLATVVPIPFAENGITFSPNPAQAGDTVTGTVTLSKPALMDTPVTLSSNSKNATVLPTVTVKQGATSATFEVQTSADDIVSGGNTVATVAAFYATDFQAQLTIDNAADVSLSLSPETVEPGQPATGTVSLEGPAAMDTVVPLSSSSPDAVVPASLKIAKGQTSATFQVKTNAPNLAQGDSIAAIIKAGSDEATLTIQKAALASFTLSPGTVTVGEAATGTVTRSTPAPLDTVIPLTSSSPRAEVPPTVTIPQGQSSATFPVTGLLGFPGDSGGSATITAENATANLTVQQPALYPRVSTGETQACALTTSAKVVCWGGFGDEGKVPAGLAGVKEVSAGGFSTCALKDDGTVVCWGNLRPPFNLSGVTQLDVGGGHACAVKSEGTVTCWGNNNDNQATPPSGLSGVTQVSAGTEFTCALKADGTVTCWGDPGPWSSPPAGLSGIKSITTGYSQGCALKTDGAVVCWGQGNGVTPPGGLSGVIQVSASDGVTCAVKNDGSLVCWGSNNFPQPPSSAEFVQVGAGLGFGCALKNDGTVTCWGEDDFGQTKPPAGFNTLN